MYVLVRFQSVQFRPTGRLILDTATPVLEHVELSSHSTALLLSRELVRPEIIVAHLSCVRIVCVVRRTANLADGSTALVLTVPEQPTALRHITDIYIRHLEVALVTVVPTGAHLYCETQVGRDTVERNLGSLAIAQSRLYLSNRRVSRHNVITRVRTVGSRDGK